MLDILKIKNVAIIDSAEIHFKKGLNIISGETGAGKSIVIEAISLLLGSRANTELIRSGCDEATVEGLFEIADIPWMKERIERLGFDTSENTLLIKRTVNRAGRHRIYINGDLATLSALQNLCEGLVDLCGQHEHQSLLRPNTQLDLLDRYGGLKSAVHSFSEVFSEARDLAHECNQITSADSERTKRADFLKFQIDELKSASLKPGEDEVLATEKSLLQSAGSRVQLSENARHTIENDEEGALQLTRTALVKIKSLNQLDESTTDIRESLERAIAELENVCIRLSSYASSADLNPERLEEVQERLSMIADLKRKYGKGIAEMLQSLDQLERELSSLENSDTRLAEIQAKLNELELQLKKSAKKLTQARIKAAQLFSDSVSGEFKDLKMEGAQLNIELETMEKIEEWTFTGADKIQFLVRTNRGEAPKPISKIASGGELSRLMLAIRRVIADKGGIGVYLFDEIDAGIGGQTAFQVGKKLRSVAKFNQVICITHLPQVASFANRHLIVRKSSKGKRTITEITELSAIKERREELARMLAGPELTKKSLANAEELLSLAGAI